MNSLEKIAKYIIGDMGITLPKQAEVVFLDELCGDYAEEYCGLVPHDEDCPDPSAIATARECVVLNFKWFVDKHESLSMNEDLCAALTKYMARYDLYDTFASNEPCAKLLVGVKILVETDGYSVSNGSFESRAAEERFNERIKAAFDSVDGWDIEGDEAVSDEGENLTLSPCVITGHILEENLAILLETIDNSHVSHTLTDVFKPSVVIYSNGSWRIPNMED